MNEQNTFIDDDNDRQNEHTKQLDQTITDSKDQQIVVKNINLKTFSDEDSVNLKQAYFHSTSQNNSPRNLDKNNLDKSSKENLVASYDNEQLLIPNVNENENYLKTDQDSLQQNISTKNSPRTPRLINIKNSVDKLKITNDKSIDKETKQDSFRNRNSNNYQDSIYDQDSSNQQVHNSSRNEQKQSNNIDRINFEYKRNIDKHMKGNKFNNQINNNRVTSDQSQVKMVFKYKNLPPLHQVNKVKDNHLQKKFYKLQNKCDQIDFNYKGIEKIKKYSHDREQDYLKFKKQWKMNKTMTYNMEMATSSISRKFISQTLSIKLYSLEILNKELDFDQYSFKVLVNASQFKFQSNNQSKNYSKSSTINMNDNQQGSFSKGEIITFEILLHDKLNLKENQIQHQVKVFEKYKNSTKHKNQELYSLGKDEFDTNLLMCCENEQIKYLQIANEDGVNVLLKVAFRNQELKDKMKTIHQMQVLDQDSLNQDGLTVEQLFKNYD